jgi:dipeptidyl aminopeptidase/acylaminoacyl peptidase
MRRLVGRTNHIASLAACCVFVAACLRAGIHLSAAAAAEREPIATKLLSIEDLYRFDAPRNPVLSPDGRKVAFARQWIDRETKRERQSLWIVEGSRADARPVEKDEPDGRAPVFSPDGRWVAFLSTRPRPQDWKQTPPVPPESDPATDIWLTDGSVVLPLAGPEKPYGRVFGDSFYGRVAFSPDGRRLVFVADDGRDPRTPAEIEADVYIVRPDQGEGYTGYGPAQVWVAELDLPGPGVEKSATHASLRIERLTSDDVWYGDPQWLPDSRSIVVHANKTADREAVRYSINKNFDLWQIDVASTADGKYAVRQLTTGPGPEVSPRVSPDGKRIACLSVPRKGSHRDVFNLAVVTLGDGGARIEVLFDHHGPDAEQPPHLRPSFPLPADCWEDADHLVYSSEVGVETKTERVNLRTKKSEPSPAEKRPAPSRGQTMVERSQRRGELMPPGNLFLKERRLAETRVVQWENDGLRLEGLLTVPPADVAKPPYKLILYPHGGPHSRTAKGFDFTVQVFAAQGYAVFQPNFRGSHGYGQKFIDADRHDFGGGDMRDILTGIDSLVREKVVDARRQFVYGISYGGYMTAWLVGHTNQFRAAVAQNAVTDLNAMWGLSDIQSWTEWEFSGRPWEAPGAMRQHSPITYAANVRTPTLVLHSRDDRRCPLPMGRMFYQSLLSRGVETQMVIYPNEGHGIQQPKHREDVLRRTLAWFAKHDPSR